MALTTQITPQDDLRKHTTRLDIQGLRAVAVIAVVAFHAGFPIPGGFVGVDIFFVISGYVITAMLLRDWSAHQRIDLTHFYIRRIKRLLPALFLVVFVTLALSFMLGSPFDGQQRTTALTAIGAMTMTANAVIFLNSGGYFAVPPTANPLLNMWSLSVEEQFYLVFPLLLIGLLVLSRKFSTRQRNIRPVLIGLFVLAFFSFLFNLMMSLSLVTSGFTDPDWFAFYASPTRAWEFAVGAIAYMITAKLIANMPRSVVMMFFWTGLLGIAVSLFFIDEYMVFPGWIALLPVIATALTLIAGAANIRGKYVLTNPVMVSFGDVSYSWYLWHWPLISFAILLFPEVGLAPGIAYLLALVIAALSLRFVENPLRFSLSWNGWRVAIFALTSVAVIALMSIAMLFGTNRSWGDSDIQDMSTQVSAQHLWLTTNCNSSIPLGLRGSECTWNPDGQDGVIFLLGDSMAGALSEGVLVAATQSDKSVMVGTMGACPFLAIEIRISMASDDDCNDFVDQSLKWLLRQPPSEVIISSWIGYLALDYVYFIDPYAGTAVRDFVGKERLYLEGIESTVRQLTEVGHKVTVVLPPPGFPLTLMGSSPWYPSQCSTISALRNISRCGQSREEIEVIRETQEIFSGMQSAVEGSGGEVFDPRSIICREDQCSTNTGNNWNYLDGFHISVGMSERLAPQILSFLS